MRARTAVFWTRHFMSGSDIFVKITILNPSNERRVTTWLKDEVISNYKAGRKLIFPWETNSTNV